MFPIIATIHGTSIHSYGLLIALGYLASLFIGTHLAKIRQREIGPFLDLALISIFSGVIGARLFFVATNLDYFRKFPTEILDFWSGGLVFYGGFIVGFLANIIYLKWRKLPIAETFDICAPALAAGHAIGRIGCLAAGCCHGSICHLPWAVTINTDLVDPSLRNIPIHPTQAYEAIALALLAGYLYFKVKSRAFKNGGVSFIYLMGYAAIRFVVEYFRGDSIRGFLWEPWVSTSQGIALVLFIASAAFFVSGFRRDH